MNRVPKLPSGAHRKAGYFDKAGRWYPHQQYVVGGTFQVRAPSRAWTSSYLKHFYTRKYAQRLAEDAPELYGALVAAHVTKQLMEGW